LLIPIKGELLHPLLRMIPVQQSTPNPGQFFWIPTSLATFSYLATSAGIILRMFMREESPVAKAFEGCAHQT
jgi:hypothetical protein